MKSNELLNHHSRAMAALNILAQQAGLKNGVDLVDVVGEPVMNELVDALTYISFEAERLATDNNPYTSECETVTEFVEDIKDMHEM